MIFYAQLNLYSKLNTRGENEDEKEGFIES